MLNTIEIFKLVRSQDGEERLFGNQSQINVVLKS